MRIASRRSAQLLVRWLACCVGAFCLATPSHAVQGQVTPSTNASTLGAGNPAPAAVRGVLELPGPWRFQMGDDPRWADPGFDDSAWPSVVLDQPLNAQGIEPYSGFGWYRIHLDTKQLDPFGTTPLELLIASRSIGQLAVYVNGVEAGRTRGMTDLPAMYQSAPLVARLSGPDSSGSRVLAIRTWSGPGIPIRSGLLSQAEIGTHAEIADRLLAANGRLWNEQVTSAVIVAFLFLCVAGLGAALYFAQRNHSEYIWLALLCVAVAAGYLSDVAVALDWMSLPAYQTFRLFAGRIFMAVTLEFVLRFTGSPQRRLVRILQIVILLVPFLSFSPFGQLFTILSVGCELAFSAVACAQLYRGWRQGSKEAGVMLLPVLIAAASDSIETVLQYAADRHLIPQNLAPHPHQLGPIVFTARTVAFIVFLASLVAVILYRFIRVSQDEQRSNAELAAASSVQALLIPTQLPSTRNFMLESAYLPVHGVGGDFFQVLPVKDDSLLIVVGDVSGKGLQAAMNSSTLVGALAQ